MSAKNNNLRRENRLFAKLVHKKYIASGLTLTELEKKIGLSAQVICLLFSGKRGIGLPFAIQIANVLGIDLGALQRKFQKGKIRVRPGKRKHNSAPSDYLRTS